MHETWLHHYVPHSDPAPTMLTEYENENIVGFRWWTAEELRATDETVYPPYLGDRLAQLGLDGFPTTPVDIAAS